MWHPLKIYDNSPGKRSFYLQNETTRLIKKGYFPFHPDIPVYQKNPKYPYYFSKEKEGLIQRTPQVGDVVYCQCSDKFGECVEDQSEHKMKVRTKDSQLFETHKDNIKIVHHAIIGMSIADTERILETCLLNFTFIEEVNFSVSQQMAFAQNWLHDHSADLGIIDEVLLLELHRQIFGKVFDWGGSYREEELLVGRNNWPTPEFEKVPELMRTFMNNDLGRITGKLSKETELNMRSALALAKFYFKLCEIHPFKDGNGRVSRLLIQFMLVCFLDEPVILDWGDIKRLSAKMDRAFDCAREKGVLKPLAQLILRASRSL